MGLLGNSELEDHPAGTGDLNAIITGNWGVIESWFNPAFGFTASQAGTTVTANAPIFTSANIGDTVTWFTGQTGVIQAGALTGTPSTTCTLSTSQTVGASPFMLYHVNADNYTAIARALLKQTVIGLNDGDAIIWSAAANRFVAGGAAGKTSIKFTAQTGTTLTNSVAATSVIPAGVGSMTFGANSSVVGRTVRVRAWGWITSAAAAGTFRLQIKHGATVIGDTGAVAMTNNLANALFHLDFDFTIRAIGAGGAIKGQGFASFNAGGLVLPIVNTVDVAVDTTIARLLDIVATWGTANAGNIFTFTNLTVEVMN